MYISIYTQATCMFLMCEFKFEKMRLTEINFHSDKNYNHKDMIYMMYKLLSEGCFD